MLESRTNNPPKFNFIGKRKKTDGVLKFFLKGRQIKNFKLLYINLFFSGQGDPRTTLAWTWRYPRSEDKFGGEIRKLRDRWDLGQLVESFLWSFLAIDDGAIGALLSRF